ncbi:hypothetical protein MC885_018690 [Smutsia gigantea]|nr:hypothetical protein MC885_018690 [Smutsia gigantea]
MLHRPQEDPAVSPRWRRQSLGSGSWRT